MFLVNSRHPLFCATWFLHQVTLIPKLRVHFAEFLQHRSLKRLGILYLPTCVGLGYGLNVGAISWNLIHLHIQSYKDIKLQKFVTLYRYRNINLFPIDYAFQPRLRGRLTLRRLALRRKPWDFGDSVSHTVYRYSCQHSHFRYLQHFSQSAFAGLRNAPLPQYNVLPTASVCSFSPVTSSAQSILIRPVSYYAFFKGWLLLSQPPGCFGRFTSFLT